MGFIQHLTGSFSLFHLLIFLLVFFWHQFLPRVFFCRQVTTSWSWIFSLIFLLFVSIGNMCAMTADRYFSVVQPMTYFQNMTNSRALRWIVAAWVIPIIFSPVPFTWIFSKSLKKREKAQMIFGTIQIISFNISPCIIMMFVYVHIFIISQKHSRQIRALTVNQRRTEPDTLNPRQKRQERSATKAFGLLLLFFLLCWLLSAYRHFCGYLNLSCPISVGTVITSRFLMVINSAVNPFIYAFLKTDIRREVKRRICRRKTTAKSFSHRLSTIN